MNKVLRTTRDMKDSGIEWIGEIPKGWEVIPLKYLINISSGDSLSKEEISNTDVYPVYGGGNMIGFCSKTNANQENILIGRVGNCGHVTLLKSESWATDNALIISTNKPLKFIYFLLMASNLKKLNTSTAQPLITAGKIKNFKVSLPPFFEQQVIANYLDEQVGKIDDLILEQKDAINKWKEYKQSLIAETVTKGLNSNVEMKDSGIEWIEKIPEYWKCKKIKYLFKIKKQIANSLGYDVLSVTQNGLKIKDISKNEGQLSMDYSKYQLVEPNDFVMNHMDLLTGYVDCSNFYGVTSPDYRVFIMTSNNSHAYYKYLFQLCYKNRIFYGLGQGVSNLGRWRLQTEAFNNFKMPVPPLHEQYAIVSYLDEKCLKIDEIIEQKQLLIKQLEEYKQSLIYECVTGKKQIIG